MMAGRSKKRKTDKTFAESIGLLPNSVWRNSWASAWGYRDGSDGAADAHDGDADDDVVGRGSSAAEEEGARNVVELIGLIFGAGGAIVEQAALARSHALFKFFNDGTCASSSVQCISIRQIRDNGATLGMAAKTIASLLCTPGGALDSLLMGSLHYDLAMMGANLGSKFTRDGRRLYCPKTRALQACPSQSRGRCVDV